MNNWRYRFEFDPDRTIIINARWNAERGVIEADPGVGAPAPAVADSLRLEVDQCSHCPLSPDQSPQCPLAASVIPVAQRFDRFSSTDRVAVIASSDDREVRVETSLQRGLGSLLGLLMGGSACPHFAAFRPMARLHLPFASEEETFFRVIGSALLELALRGEPGDLGEAGEHIRRQYQALSVVNRGMASRLRRFARTDSGVNAVIVLDMFARLIGGDPDEYIESLRPLYPAN